MLAVTRRLIFFCPKTFGSSVFSPVNCNVIPKGVTLIKNARFKYKGVQFEVIPGSRYAPPSLVETVEDYIVSTLNDKNSMTDEEWEDFRSELIHRHANISEDNFSSVIMNAFLVKNKLDLSHNFIKYLENSTAKPNFLTYLKYISLCSKNRKAVDQERILRILDKVIKQINLSPAIDVKRAEYIIQGLCATDRWRESFIYLGKLLNRKPSQEICNAMACAAIRNGDENLAWEILKNWLDSYDHINDKVTEEFITVALKKQKENCRESDKFIVNFFQYMQKRDIIMSLNVAKLVEQYFLNHRLKWNITYTKVSRKGVCDSCNSSLQLLELTPNEFDELQNAFLHRVLKKSDIYINTNKTEFDRYIEFINSNKPFHIVIDGLNAAYSLYGYRTKKRLSLQLLRVIKEMSGKSRRLLVLGRKHMKTWTDIYKISKRAKLFFTDNISNDDPFVMYAALVSGPHTLFLSGDLMRDHMSRLADPRLIYLFRRWQLSHQMFIQSDENSDIKFIEPLRHSITVQGNMEYGWHIPFDDKIILDPYEELNNWLCIQKVI